MPYSIIKDKEIQKKLEYYRTLLLQAKRLKQFKRISELEKQINELMKIT